MSESELDAIKKTWNPDWRAISFRFNWCAVDRNGRVVGFEREPRVIERSGRWDASGGYELYYTINLNGLDWTRTKRHRPIEAR